jgi:hypothetical protein
MWHQAWHVWCKKGARGLLYCGSHVVRGKMRIALGLLNGLVSQKFSHGEEVYPILDGMGSEGMPERMEGNLSAGQRSLADKGDEGMSQSAKIPLRKPGMDRDRTLLEHSYHL